MTDQILSHMKKFPCLKTICSHYYSLNNSKPFGREINLTRNEYANGKNKDEQYLLFDFYIWSGVYFINCFTPYAELSRQTFAPVKNFSKVGRRGRKLGVGVKNHLWNRPQHCKVATGAALLYYVYSFLNFFIFLD